MANANWPANLSAEREYRFRQILWCLKHDGKVESPSGTGSQELYDRLIRRGVHLPQKVTLAKDLSDLASDGYGRKIKRLVRGKRTLEIAVVSEHIGDDPYGVETPNRLPRSTAGLTTSRMSWDEQLETSPYRWPSGVSHGRKKLISQSVWTILQNGPQISRNASGDLATAMQRRGLPVSPSMLRPVLAELASAKFDWLVARGLDSTATWALAIRMPSGGVAALPPCPFDDATVSEDRLAHHRQVVKTIDSKGSARNERDLLDEDDEDMEGLAVSANGSEPPIDDQVDMAFAVIRDALKAKNAELQARDKMIAQKQAELERANQVVNAIQSALTPRELSPV